MSQDSGGNSTLQLSDLKSGQETDCPRVWAGVGKAELSQHWWQREATPMQACQQSPEQIPYKEAGASEGKMALTRGQRAWNPGVPSSGCVWRKRLEEGLTEHRDAATPGHELVLV
jgi:hypothetical protein